MDSLADRVTTLELAVGRNGESDGKTLFFLCNTLSRSLFTYFRLHCGVSVMQRTLFDSILAHQL